MLDVGRRLNPECEHVEGDMRTLRVGRTFDAVFVHDAVSCITEENDLRAVVETAYAHLRPGGAALFVPDWVRETFVPSTTHGGNDGEGRALRFVECDWDPDPNDTTYVAGFAYLLRDTDGSVRVEHDRHVMGLFPRTVWIQILETPGSEPASSAPSTARRSARISSWECIANRVPRRPRPGSRPLPGPPEGRPRPARRT